VNWRDPQTQVALGLGILSFNAVALYMRWLIPLDAEIPERIWLPTSLVLLVLGLALLTSAGIRWLRRPRVATQRTAPPWPRRPETYAILAFVAFPAFAMASARLSGLGRDGEAVWNLGLLAGFLLLGVAAWLGRRRAAPGATPPEWASMSAFTLGLGLTLALFDWVERRQGMEGPPTFAFLSLVSGAAAGACWGWLTRPRALGLAMLVLLGMLGAWASLVLLFALMALTGGGGA